MSDEYERAYLGGDEAVHREKRVSRQTFGIMTTLSVLLGGMAAVSLAAFAGGDPQGLGGAILLGGIAVTNGVLGVALSVGRTVVTGRELRFMVGIRNRSVPLAAITSTSVHALRPPALRADVAKDGAELSSIFGAGDYVRVAYADPAGVARVVWIGSDDAAALRGAIERARGASAPPKTRVEIVEDAAEEAGSASAAKEISRGSP